MGAYSEINVTDVGALKKLADETDTLAQNIKSNLQSAQSNLSTLKQIKLENKNEELINKLTELVDAIIAALQVLNDISDGTREQQKVLTKAIESIESHTRKIR